MMGHKEKLKTRDEGYTVGPWRDAFNPPTHKIKKRMTRRNRRKANISTKAIPGHYEYDPVEDYPDPTEAR